ncbi:hypothetical protein [Agromyces sp. SYSU T0242]|uniref:hypothetical protein n=1 Tax=Agromyces litoreus TaxID=3158561 RepID=UPI003391270E
MDWTFWVGAIVIAVLVLVTQVFLHESRWSRRQRDDEPGRDAEPGRDPETGPGEVDAERRPDDDRDDHGDERPDR